MDAARFAHVRPFLYHVTARENLELITRTGALHPAIELMRLAERSDLRRWKRSQPALLSVEGTSVVLSDQLPLREERTTLYRGWSFADYIEYLNEHVFFWPGNADGPSKTGVLSDDSRHEGATAILRVGTAELMAANPSVPPLFCAIHVRAARSPESRRVSRGPRLFMPAEDFARREIEVVEVAFRASLLLPESTVVRDHDAWTPLSSSGTIRPSPYK